MTDLLVGRARGGIDGEIERDRTAWKENQSEMKQNGKKRGLQEGEWSDGQQHGPVLYSYTLQQRFSAHTLTCKYTQYSVALSRWDSDDSFSPVAHGTGETHTHTHT